MSVCIHCGDIKGVDGKCDCGSRHYLTKAELKEREESARIESLFDIFAEKAAAHGIEWYR